MTLSPLSHSPVTVLVAEDNADDLFLLRQAFTRAEVRVQFHAVCDGLEALAYLEGSGAFGDRQAYPAPDVLLLDLNMPRRNGFEVLEWIRRDPRWSRLLVHVFTASARAADVQRAYDLRANSFVVKPTRMDELITFVAALQAWHRFVVPAPASLPSGTAQNPGGGNGRPGGAAP